MRIIKQVFLSFFAVLLIFTSQSCKNKDSNTIEIGVIAPLTGQIASNGNSFLNGLEMGIADANSKGGIQMRIVVEDCHSNTKDANNAYRKLKGRKIKYFVGFGGQFVAGFAAETNNTDEVLFAVAAPNKSILKMTNRCFGVSPTVDAMTDKICEYIDSLNYNRIGIVYMQFEVYLLYYESIIQKLQDKGKEIVFAESYDPSTRDFKGIISKLSNTGVDILYTAGAGESSSLLTRQLFSNPKTEKIPVIGDMNFSNSDNLEMIGTKKAPICAVDNYMDSSFASTFKQRNGKNADSFALYGYLVASILKQSIDSMDKDYTTDDVFKYIHMNSFDTVGGPVSFDSVTNEPILQLIFKETTPNE